MSDDLKYIVDSSAIGISFIEDLPFDPKDGDIFTQHVDGSFYAYVFSNGKWYMVAGADESIDQCDTTVTINED